MRRLSYTALAAAIGCTDAGLDDPRFQTGSQSMTADSSYSALYVTNTDKGRISRVKPGSTYVGHLDLGGEPTRIARSGDRLFVTLRADRSVAVVRTAGESMELETKIEVGAEPFGVVASEDGKKVYVSSSMSHRIDEIDAEGLTIVRSWSTPVEPRWIALHPSGRTLYVTSPYSGHLFYIPLDGDRVESVPLPDGSISSAFVTTARPFTARVTGDMAVNPSGFDVAIPTLYVDNNTPIDDTIPAPSFGGYYGGGRLNPVAAVVPVDNDGAPIGEYSFLLNLSGIQISGYPASLTYDPKGELVFATMEGGGGVVATSLVVGGAEDQSFLDKAFAGGATGFQFHPLQGVATVEGPRSIVFLGEGKAWTHGFIDDAVQNVEADDMARSLERTGSDSRFGRGVGEVLAGQKLDYDDSGLSRELAEGRRLFYANNDSRMAAPLSGLSCATCHFDGRSDGLTWAFTKGPRQTPSLAGNISVTEPVRWLGDRETVQVDILRTSQDAMGGGNGLLDSDLDAVAAYVDHTRDVLLEKDALDQGAVARGKAIFERADVACASCHNGERYTNNQFYDMLGLYRVKTRPLVGIAATAPYFHDGSAATLADVVERSRDGSMGNTGSLSDTEARDLTEYLRSL